MGEIKDELIKAINEEFEDKTYKIGDRFIGIIDQQSYLLSEVGASCVALINVEDGVALQLPSIEVFDLHCITQKEFNGVLDSGYSMLRR